MKKIVLPYLLLFSSPLGAQNLVPNPGFEDTLGCFPGFPALECLDYWKDHSDPANPALNTADLCFNTAVFFPPSSIPAFEGTKYIGIDCQPMNSEYVQVRLSQPMIAGTSYCVSFYASVCDQTLVMAPSLGVFFSVNERVTNPYTDGLTAHVEGTPAFDPTAWTKITGTYLASGGEEYMTLGGFQNNGGGFTYMYIDWVEVYPLPFLYLGGDLPICSGQSLVISGNSGASGYLWSTGETTGSISVSAPGTYWLAQESGACLQTDTIKVFDDCDPAPVNPAGTEATLFVPNAFTPDGDGLNDLFGAIGENIYDYELLIFDRWGERIFRSQSLASQWDGRFRGNAVEQGVYVWKLSYRKLDRHIYSTGHVALIR